MITLRRSAERRHVRRSKQEVWLTFFPEEHPGRQTVSFGLLTAFDEVWLSPGAGSITHREDEAEVVTYVHRGVLAQEDSTGRSGTIQAGEFQCMTSGRRIRHKETNASRTDGLHLFRSALYPSTLGLDRAHEQKRFTAAQRRNTLCLIASPDGRRGSLRVHQDAFLYSSILETGHHLFHELLSGRTAWLHIVHGEATLSDHVLTAGDGAGLTFEPSVSLTVQKDTEILLIDLGPASSASKGDATSTPTPRKKELSMSKQRSSSSKREREMKKRQRERQKREKTAARREARQNKKNAEPPDPSDSAPQAEEPPAA
jgi:redox-sensitive bicupin YhaK (pirin superfamily)